MLLLFFGGVSPSGHVLAPSDEGAVERMRDWGRDRCFAESLVFIGSPSGALRHLPRQREALVRCITRVRSTATRVYGTIGLYPLVFPAGGEAAPDVPLRLVFVQQRLYLQPQRAVVQRQPFADAYRVGKLRVYFFYPVGYVFMYRRDELERLPPSPDRPTAGGKCPHSHPCPLQSSG